MFCIQDCIVTIFRSLLLLVSFPTCWWKAWSPPRWWGPWSWAWVRVWTANRSSRCGRRSYKRCWCCRTWRAWYWSGADNCRPNLRRRRRRRRKRRRRRRRRRNESNLMLKNQVFSTSRTESNHLQHMHLLKANVLAGFSLYLMVLLCSVCFVKMPSTCQGLQMKIGY